MIRYLWVCPRIALGGALLGAALLAWEASEVQAQAGRARVEEGNRLYGEGRFAEAHEEYLEALAEAPGSSVVSFNDGNALYQDADYQRAMDAYQRAIEASDPALASSAWYNLGNTLYRQQQLEPSLEAFKQALRIDPSDPDAKHNLERVLEQMQQQEAQQRGDSEQDDDDEERQEDRQQEGQQPQPEPQSQSSQDQGDEPEQAQPPSDGDQQLPPEGQGQPERQPGEMTREEAERLLDAVEEDPEDVNRQPPTSVRGRRPRKPW